MNPIIPKPDSPQMPTLDDAIKDHPFLAGLSARHREILRENAMFVRYGPGEVIFREGDPANRFYLIQTGEVQLESARRDDEPVPVQIIGPGDVLGWSWLFPPYYWHFDARAVEPTTAIFFYGTRLREECEKDPDLGYDLMKRMTRTVIQRLQSVRRKLFTAS